MSAAPKFRVHYEDTPSVAPAADRLKQARTAITVGEPLLAFRHVRQLLTTLPDLESALATEVVTLTAALWPALIEHAPFDKAHQSFLRVFEMRPRVGERLAATLEALPPSAARDVALALVFTALGKLAEAGALLVKIDLSKLSRPFAQLIDAVCAAVMKNAQVQRARGWASKLHLPYPLHTDGRPMMSTVWLEVTSHCNQKCTFCPDPARESKRQHIDVPRFKQLVDELQADFHVGHMELNAYGEPLLNPKLGEMLAYLREKKVPWPTYFTTHGLTLLDSKIELLDKLHPTGLAISLHNDSQESYAATRSAKIGDYETLVARVSKLLQTFITNKRACSVRLYLMVRNGKEHHAVPPETLQAFPNDWRRFAENVRFWQNKLHAMAPEGAEVMRYVNSDEQIQKSFESADQGTWENNLGLIGWRDENGGVQNIFITPRPTGSYANLIPSMSPERYKVQPTALSSSRCSFTERPSLAIFAGGELGICCIDLEGTANFGKLHDYANLKEAVSSQKCRDLFGELANGVCNPKGCQTCLGYVEHR